MVGRDAPCRTLRKRDLKRDVEVVVIRFVETADVAVDYRERYLSFRHHLHKILRDERVAVDLMDDYASAELLIQIAEPLEIFGTLLHIYFASHELRDVGNQLFLAPLGLYEHLVGDVLNSAWYHFLTVFAGDRHLVGKQIYQPGVEHLYRSGKRRGYLQAEMETFVGRKPADKVIVISHRFLTVDEI